MVPVEDVFRATGFGTAGIVRQRPNGKLSYAFFNFSLLQQGVTAIFGKDDVTEQDIIDISRDMKDLMPEFALGSPELAARYIWGAYSLSLVAGYDLGPDADKYLALVPAIVGSRKWWVQQLTGPQGLAAPGLVEFLEANPTPDDIPDDKEVVVFTRATFACDNAAKIRAELKRQAPEFGDDGIDDSGAHRFIWTRAYPKNHWSPFSKMGGRQILGSVEVYDDRVIAEAKVLSMAAILIGKLKSAFDDDIRLTETQWKSAADLVREGKSLL